MKGYIGGALGPTGPTPLQATGASGTAPRDAYQGVWLQVPTGTAYVAGSSGGCTTGSAFILGATGAPFFMPGTTPRLVHVIVNPGSQVRWLFA